MGNLALFFEHSGVELARAGYRHVEVGGALVLQVAASLKVEIDVIAEYWCDRQRRPRVLLNSAGLRCPRGSNEDSLDFRLHGHALSTSGAVASSQDGLRQCRPAEHQQQALNKSCCEAKSRLYSRRLEQGPIIAVRLILTLLPPFWSGVTSQIPASSGSSETFPAVSNEQIGGLFNSSARTVCAESIRGSQRQFAHRLPPKRFQASPTKEPQYL